MVQRQARRTVPLSKPEADITGEHKPPVSHATRCVDQEQLRRGTQPEAASRVQCDCRFGFEIAAPSAVWRRTVRDLCIPDRVSLVYATAACRDLKPVMPQGKNESSSKGHPCETIMDVKVPKFTVYNACRVIGRQYAPFECQPAAEPKAVCSTQGHSAESLRPTWDVNLPSVPAIESELIPFRRLAICQEGEEAREKGDPSHKPREALRRPKDGELKFAAAR